MTVLGSRDGSAEPDVLSSFLPPWKARRDSASELNGDDAPLDCLDTAAAYDEEPVPEEGRAYEHTLRQLRHLATSLGVQRVPKSAYTTDRVLQTGGFGKVSLVHVEGVDQRLALKTVELHKQADPHTCGSPNFDVLDTRRVQRLQQEVALLSALRPAAMAGFPLLPALYDFGTYNSGRRAFVALTWVPGTDLRSRLAASEQNVLPVQVARFFTAEVLLALEVIHDAGFVYRDLKPENVMVNELSKHCVLIDFDLAVPRPETSEDDLWAATPIDEAFKAADEFDAAAPDELSPPPSRRGSHEWPGGVGSWTGSSPAIHAVTGMPLRVAGTAEYAAPEVVAGCCHGVAADTWQVGVLLYELLFGVTPFARNRPAAGTVGEAPMGLTPAHTSHDRLFRCIRGAALRFPDAADTEGELETAARDLLRAMLRRTFAPSDPRVRLQEADVRDHAFFRGLDWDTLPYEPPPVDIPPARIKGSAMNLADLALGLED